jgi:hypothetical protein
MQENALIQHLLHLGATHIYSDYWTCNRIIFASNERIICASLDEHLGTGFDRYPPYRTIVDADGYASYVFPLDSPQATVFAEIHQGDTQYRQYVFEDYVVYQPDPPKTNEYSISLPQVCLASYNLEGGKYVPLSVRNAAHQLAT